MTDKTLLAIQEDYNLYSALMPFSEWIREAIKEFGEDNITEWREAREEGEI